jgi:hypothetical protein
VSGWNHFGSQVSGFWRQVRIVRFGIRLRDLYLNLDTWTRYPMAETRDLEMCTAANHPVSGPPLLFILTANR